MGLIGTAVKTAVKAVTAKATVSKGMSSPAAKGSGPIGSSSKGGSKGTYKGTSKKNGKNGKKVSAKSGAGAAAIAAQKPTGTAGIGIGGVRFTGPTGLAVKSLLAKQGVGVIPSGATGKVSTLEKPSAFFPTSLEGYKATPVKPAAGVGAVSGQEYEDWAAAGGAGTTIVKAAPKPPTGPYVPTSYAQAIALAKSPALATLGALGVSPQELMAGGLGAVVGAVAAAKESGMTAAQLHQLAGRTAIDLTKAEVDKAVAGTGTVSQAMEGLLATANDESVAYAERVAAADEYNSLLTSQQEAQSKLAGYMYTDESGQQVFDYVGAARAGVPIEDLVRAGAPAHSLNLVYIGAQYMGTDPDTGEPTLDSAGLARDYGDVQGQAIASAMGAQLPIARDVYETMPESMKERYYPVYRPMSQETGLAGIYGRGLDILGMGEGGWAESLGRATGGFLDPRTLIPTLGIGRDWETYGPRSIAAATPVTQFFRPQILEGDLSAGAWLGSAGNIAAFALMPGAVRGAGRLFGAGARAVGRTTLGQRVGSLATRATSATLIEPGIRWTATVPGFLGATAKGVGMVARPVTAPIRAISRPIARAIETPVYRHAPPGVVRAGEFMYWWGTPGLPQAFAGRIRPAAVTAQAPQVQRVTARYGPPAGAAERPMGQMYTYGMTTPPGAGGLPVGPGPVGQSLGQARSIGFGLRQRGIGIRGGYGEFSMEEALGLKPLRAVPGALEPVGTTQPVSIGEIGAGRELAVIRVTDKLPTGWVGVAGDAPGLSGLPEGLRLIMKSTATPSEIFSKVISRGPRYAGGEFYQAPRMRNLPGDWAVDIEFGARSMLPRIGWEGVQTMRDMPAFKLTPGAYGWGGGGGPSAPLRGVPSSGASYSRVAVLQPMVEAGALRPEALEMIPPGRIPFMSREGVLEQVAMARETMPAPAIPTILPIAPFAPLIAPLTIPFTAPVMPIEVPGEAERIAAPVVIPLRAPVTIPFTPPSDFPEEIVQPVRSPEEYAYEVPFLAPVEAPATVLAPEPEPVLERGGITVPFMAPPMFFEPPIYEPPIEPIQPRLPIIPILPLFGKGEGGGSPLGPGPGLGLASGVWNIPQLNLFLPDPFGMRKMKYVLAEETAQEYGARQAEAKVPAKRRKRQVRIPTEPSTERLGI